MVTYVNKKGQRKTYRLSQAIDSGDMEMYKRLKYTKDIMTQMLSNNSPNPTSRGRSTERLHTGGAKNMAKTQTRFGAGLKT